MSFYSISPVLINGTWRSLASAPALGAGGRRFESARPEKVPVAQLDRATAF